MMSGRRLIVLIVVGGLAGAGLWAYRRQTPAAAAPIAGMVRRTEIRIAPDISGRLASIAVTPGQHVRAGEVLAIIDNPDLAASLAEAEAAAESAAADRANTDAGVRAEQVSIDAEAVRTAEANLLLARQQNDRAVTLNSHSFLSQQQLDESTASLLKAKADLDGKVAAEAAAKAGPTTEERRLADARLALAKAAVATLQAQVTKTRLLAPVDGTVGIRVAEPGEIMVPGKSVMTLEIDGRPWFGFTMREDALPGVEVGSVVPLTDAHGTSIEARVTEMRPLGEFATWRAARAVGDHDLNSFRLRLDPVDDAPENRPLEPGMTVWYTKAQR